MKNRATRIPLVVIVIFACACVLAVAMNGRASFHVTLPAAVFEEVLELPQQETGVTEEPAEVVPPEEQPPHYGKFVALALLALVLFLLGIAGRKLVTLLGSRREHEDGDPLGSETDDSVELKELLIPKVAHALDQAIDRLQPGSNAKNAIIEAWHALEIAVEESGVERSPAHTPTEFTINALSQLDLDAIELNELLGLFHKARFTDQSSATYALSQESVDTAREILMSLRGQLRGVSVGVVGSGSGVSAGAIGSGTVPQEGAES